MLRNSLFFLFTSFGLCLYATSIHQPSPYDSTKLDESALSPTTQHIFSFNSLSSYPLFYKLDSPKSSHYKHFVNLGIHVEYIYSTNTNFGIGLEYGLDFSKANLYNGGLFGFSSLIDNDDLNIYHEGMRIIANSLMPKIEWKRKKSKRPVGFVHQFGIGVWVANVLDRDYEYELNLFQGNYPEQLTFQDYNSAEETYDPNQLYDFNNKPYLGGTLMYSLIYKGELSESLLWSVGLRSQVNLSRYTFQNLSITSQFDQEDTIYWLNRREMGKIISKNRRSSIVQLQLGLTYKLDH